MGRKAKQRTLDVKRRQLSFLKQLAFGHSKADAMRIIGVSETTVRRWLKDEQFAYLATTEEGLVALQTNAVKFLRSDQIMLLAQLQTAARHILNKPIDEMSSDEVDILKKLFSSQTAAQLKSLDDIVAAPVRHEELLKALSKPVDPLQIAAALRAENAQKQIIESTSREV